VDRDEMTFDTEHRAFRETRSRYMQQLTAGNHLAVTRNHQLEHALVDGVEHTRAAREFLDSLMEMERSFAEKMRTEEEYIGHHETDKRAAIDAIKRRFYDDLHHRMELFFTTRHTATPGA
jgi:trans-aconitate methyltransferase